MKTYQPNGSTECADCEGTGSRNVVITEAKCGIPHTSKNAICEACGGKGWTGTPVVVRRDRDDRPHDPFRRMA